MKNKMKKVSVIFGVLLLTACSNSSESASREERVNKVGWIKGKNCGYEWSDGLNIGEIAKNSSDGKRDCEWAMEQYKFQLNDDNAKDCFCNGFLTGYDLNK